MLRVSLVLLLLLVIKGNTIAQVPPLTRLTDAFCYNYNLPSLYSNFSAIKQICDGYLFEVENQTTFQTASLTTYGSVAGRSTNLSNFTGAGIQYSTTYRVRVRTWIGTPSNLSGYSPVNCFVITPPATSKVQTSQCNTTLSILNSPIYADNIVGAEAFEYELTKQPSGLVNTFEKTTGTLNAFSMADFSNSFVDYNTTYQVRVRVKVNGTYGPYGTICNITTPVIPSTQLEYYCNASIPFINSALAAVQVQGADAYKFQVTDGVNTTEIFPDAPGYSAVLIPVSWATYSGTPANIGWVTNNMTVQVRVAVLVDGVWQPYGSVCNVTTPCGSRLTAAMAGKVVNYVHYDEILAEIGSCSNIEDYQFRYRTSSTSSTYITASSGTEATENSTDNKLLIADFAPITNFPGSNPYGQTFRISVRLKVNGTWTAWGTERIVYTNSSPKTKIRDGVYPVAGTSQCGSSFSSPFQMPSISTILGSYNLYGFTSSTFEVTELDALGNDVVTKYLTRSVSTFGALARSFRLNMIEASTPTGTDGYWATAFNKVFRVRVMTNLGTYGDACYVKTPAAILVDEGVDENQDLVDQRIIASPEDQKSELQDISISQDEIVEFFPNPFNNRLFVRYSEHFGGTNKISVIDLSGKVIFDSNEILLDDFINHQFFKELKDGLYYVNISSKEGSEKITKLVKSSN